MPGAQGFQRRSPRVETRQSAILIDSEGTEIAVEVIELSSGGFRLATKELLPLGEKVSIRVSRYGEFPAEIRWSTEDQAGGVFLEPVQLNPL